MKKKGTSSGLAMPPGWSKVAGISVCGSCLIVFSVMSTRVHATQNRLGTFLIVQQDQDDNYLMSSTKQQTLAGLYLKPGIHYSHDNGFEKFSANLQGSIERYNRSEYNVNNPVSAINYQRVMERTILNFGYNASRQSTRISEFKDSGNIVNGYTNQQTNTATAAWQYQLSQRNMVAANGSMQTVKYESSNYADLKNNAIQINWQSELSDRLSFYTVVSGSEYESTFNGEFYLEPQLIQGYLLCPPGSLLVSETVCFSDPIPSGNAINETMSSGLQVGLKWNLQEQLKFSLSAGVTNLDTTQTITIPEISTEYGSPIDQKVFFGGERAKTSESRLVTTNMNISYQLEASTIGLTLARKVQPSSTGSLLRIQSLDFSIRKSLSEISWIEADFTLQNLLTIDEKIINSSSVDRDIFQGNIKYGYRLSPTLVASASMGYRYQKANENRTIKANALLGVLAISYTPREWTW
ncbi:MAG: hypothetical protein V4732_00105 [Pseudomonadota bacterium]